MKLSHTIHSVQSIPASHDSCQVVGVLGKVERTGTAVVVVGEDHIARPQRCEGRLGRHKGKTTSRHGNDMASRCTGTKEKSGIYVLTCVQSVVIWSVGFESAWCQMKLMGSREKTGTEASIEQNSKKYLSLLGGQYSTVSMGAYPAYHACGTVETLTRRLLRPREASWSNRTRDPATPPPNLSRPTLNVQLAEPPPTTTMNSRVFNAGLHPTSHSCAFSVHTRQEEDLSRTIRHLHIHTF